MLRRLETYGFADHATPAERDELARVLRESGRFIPEVLDSAVGRNRSDVPVDLVWEHAYEDPAAYARYMCHPFHICVLDRYLLPEAPECITASRRELALGLLGYEVDGAPFRHDAGVRRVVAMKLDPAAAPADVDALLERLAERGRTEPGVHAAVAAPNTMGLEWFPDGWTHVWEEAHDDESVTAAAVAATPDLLRAGPVSEWVDLWYEIERDGAGR